MQLTPYLQFNGDCEKAFKFYETCLKGKIVFSMPYGETPMGAQMPADFKHKICHMSLDIGDQHLAGADMPLNEYARPQGMHVCISISAVSEAERIFKELAEGGKVQMDLQKTFWAERFGMVVDRFGTPWMINCEAKK